MSEFTAPEEDPQSASEFSMLLLLLIVCTALNRNDCYPTFTRTGNDWLWRKAGKLSPYPSVMDAVARILIMDQEILAGMAVGKGSCGPIVTQEDKEGDTYQVDMDDLNIVVICNPRNVDSVSELGYCTVTPNGIDYWAKIKMAEDGWYIFRSETPVSLCDHVTTVRAYLNDYRTKSTRAKLSSLFSEYITTTCWRKMYRRMTHWSTLGLIRSLARISDDQLKEAAEDQRDSVDVFDGKPDYRLAIRLSSLAKRYDERPTAIEAIMAYHPTAAEDKLSGLLSHCHDDPPVLYTQDTIEDFHHLIVAIFIAQGSVLARIFDALGDDRVVLGTTFTILARLLSTILNSKAMTRHLRLLKRYDLLKLPTSTATELYRDYAKKNRFGFGQTDDKDSRRNLKKEPKVDKGEETPDEDDVDCWADTDDAEAVIGGWMRALSSHYSARQILERHCYDKLKLEEVKITLLAVGCQRRTFSLENMKQTICTTLDAVAEDERLQSISKEETIQILQRKIEGSKPIEPHTKRMFWIVKELFSGFDVDHWIKPHLVSLYGHSSIADKALEDLLKSLNHDHMAVSKLCCPTCRMFLRLLGKHELGNFSVRGHHSTLHMVDLPGSLPDALLQEMITMHRHYLGELFKKIIFSPMACEIRPRTPLIENDPALRTACTVEDEFIPLPPLTSLAISLAAGLSTSGQ